MNELWRHIEGEYKEEEIVRKKKVSKQQRKMFKKMQNR
jgi:hypothetical protein